MVLGKCVLTGHDYDSLRGGVGEGCEVDGGEVDVWVVVRVRSERSLQSCGPAVKASTWMGLHLPSRQANDWGGVKASRSDAQSSLTHNL